MKILLTGANGYIGMRLLPVLVEAGQEVTCVVRESFRFQLNKELLKKIDIIDFDFLQSEKIESRFAGKQFDVAYYLIHSLKDTFISLEDLEGKTSPKIISSIKKVREGKVEKIPGYDGIYGIIKLKEDKVEPQPKQSSLFA